MHIDGQSDETIWRLLTITRRIGLAGASMKPWRPRMG